MQGATSVRARFVGSLLWPPAYGKLLSLTAAQVSVAQPKGPAVLSVGLTKAGKRQGAAESVTIHVEDVRRRLFQSGGNCLMTP